MDCRNHTFAMYGSVSEAISIDLSNAILFTAFAVTWTGARVFDGREVQPVAMAREPRVAAPSAA